MLQEDEIGKIAKAAATTTLGSQSFVTVLNAPTIDSTGNDALHITIVLTPGSTETVTGDRALNTLFQIRERLREAGELRLPIVEYATQEELAESDGSQS
jgi:hypothetical protein